MIATIAGENVQRSLRSYGNHSSAIAAIVATTIAEIDARGPFLESPHNFSGPELYFKIKICIMAV